MASFYDIMFYVLSNYLFIYFERESSHSRGGTEREGERENPKQALAPGIEPDAAFNSLTMGS